MLPSGPLACQAGGVYPPDLARAALVAGLGNVETTQCALPAELANPCFRAAKERGLCRRDRVKAVSVAGPEFSGGFMGSLERRSGAALEP